MGKIVVLYGLPAAGKTTQAELLSKKYGLHQFGMGDHLRAEIESGSELGKKIKETVDNGLLVSDELIMGVLQNIKREAQETGIIFDGFPRMIPQAKLLDRMLAEVKLEVDLFVYLKINPEVARMRISDRAMSGGRGDDKDPKVIRNRMKVFDDESTPLIAHYRIRGKLLEVDGEKSIPDVFAEIEKYL